MHKEGFVYIVTNATRSVLYTGVTSNLVQRIAQHRRGTFEGFTKDYLVDRLVYVEHHESIEDAIGREKQIKGKTRAKKIALIEAMNSNWEDLYEKNFRRDPSLRNGMVPPS